MDPLRPNATTDQNAGCLNILAAANEPIAAADLAVKLDLTGSRETKRRHVRAIVAKLRDTGAMIVGTNNGYCLTDNKAIWRDYIEGREIDAKRIFAEAHRQKRNVATPGGQGLLFGGQISVMGR